MRPRIIRRSYYSWLSLLRNALIVTVCASVMLYASVPLLATRYILQAQKAEEMLRSLQHIPSSPETVFLGCVLTLLVFGGVLMMRREPVIEKVSSNVVGAVTETLCACLLCFMLNFSYSGMFLLVFCDLVFHFRNKKGFTRFAFAVIALYFCSNYQLVSRIWPMASLQLYFEVFPEPLSNILLLCSSLTSMISFILSLAFLGVFLSWQLEENDNITQEVSMLNQVNHELQNYAAITEKIGEDKERKRLAREIHDTLGHALTGIAAGVDACLVIIDKNPQAAKNQLQLVSHVVRQGITDVRSSLKKLRPGALEQQGLKGALQKMLDEFAAVSDVQIQFSYRADGIDFEVAKEDALFRLIQESITNSLRHGKATAISISFSVLNHSLIVEIQDNGTGCEDIVSGYGLKQMQERIAVLHGQVSFDGGSGFYTRAVLPLMEGEESV